MRISDWSSDVCSSDLGPREGVVLPLVEMRRRLAVALEGLPHLGDLLRRGEAVLLGNVQRQRLLDLAGLAHRVAEAAAVVADVAVGVLACRRDARELATEAVSDIAGFAGAGPRPAHCGKGSLHSRVALACVEKTEK